MRSTFLIGFHIASRSLFNATRFLGIYGYVCDDDVLFGVPNEDQVQASGQRTPTESPKSINPTFSLAKRLGSLARKTSRVS